MLVFNLNNSFTLEKIIRRILNLIIVFQSGYNDHTDGNKSPQFKTVTIRFNTHWIHAHHLSLLELFAADKVAAKGRRHLGHDRGGVSLHSVVARLRQVTAEPQDCDPQRLSRLNNQTDHLVNIVYITSYYLKSMLWEANCIIYDYLNSNLNKCDCNDHYNLFKDFLSKSFDIEKKVKL